MLNRKECKKMWVWGHEGATKAPRIVIDIHSGGSCTAVIVEDEYAFIRGSEYATYVWTYCEEIKEPEWKPFTKNEQLEPYIDCWFRFKDFPHLVYKILVFNTKTGWFSIINGDEIDSVNLDILFESHEMKVNGVWQPVGELK